MSRPSLHLECCFLLTVLIGFLRAVNVSSLSQTQSGSFYYTYYVGVIHNCSFHSKRRVKSLLATRNGRSYVRCPAVQRLFYCACRHPTRLLYPLCSPPPPPPSFPPISMVDLHPTAPLTSPPPPLPLALLPRPPPPPRPTGTVRWGGWSPSTPRLLLPPHPPFPFPFSPPPPPRDLPARQVLQGERDDRLPPHGSSYPPPHYPSPPPPRYCKVRWISLSPITTREGERHIKMMKTGSKWQRAEKIPVSDTVASSLLAAVKTTVDEDSILMLRYLLHLDNDKGVYLLQSREQWRAPMWRRCCSYMCNEGHFDA